jgi:hypothetical protein
MKIYQGSISTIKDGHKVFFEYASLHIDKGVPFLEIISKRLQDDNWAILLGEFNDFDLSEVTFVNCRTGAYKGSSAGYIYKIGFEYGLSGNHFMKTSDIHFKKCSLYLPALTRWMNHSDFAHKLSKNQTSNSVSIPQDITVSEAVIDSLKITVKIIFPYTSNDDKFEIEKSSLVFFEENTLISYSKLKKTIGRFKKLFLFLSNVSADESTISFQMENPEENDLEIWCKLIGNINTEVETKFRDSPQLRFQDLRNQFDQIIQQWYSNEKLVVVTDLILEKKFNTELSWKSYYLNLCVAIESFTDIVKPKTLFPGVKEREIQRDLISTLIEDPDLNKWFRKNTTYWKNPETKDRLRIYNTTIEYLMGDIFEFNSEQMITKIKKTRDLIAHTGSYLKEFSQLELLISGKILEFTIRAELLSFVLPESEKVVDKFLLEGKNQLTYIAKANNYNIK